MADREFPKRFDFKEAEPRLYQRWVDARAFDAAYDKDGIVLRPEKRDAAPFVVVIPPPNVTGRLHMGHALNNTVQDILVRYKRMDGFDALWVPGTDHAGIATQSVVKKQIDAEGLDFRALGRDEVVRRIWVWKEQFGNEILKQLRRIGCSCDWSRTRFTMDDGLSEAVRVAFVKLFEAGLIYRGKRIVNWCPVDRTALSDDEVEHEENAPAKMYNIRYPFADDSGEYLVVSTTRPETLFGDVAVAVNPKDERYLRHVGRELRLPLQGRIIPVITDEHADPTKGTGCVKITPAHDPNDFEVGQRHGLPEIDVMNDDATMNEVVPEKYRGLDRYECRKRALEDLEAAGLLESIVDHEMALGRSYRSRVPIEFRLSQQWFVKMEPLASAALEASGYVKTGEGWVRTNASGLTLRPERHEKVYYHWLTNIRDWCISRQIWWGHRIPAWYHRGTGETLVSATTPDRVAAAPSEWAQDEDVLDTWFSSWLWPLSTLGWPANTPDFSRYYPTTTLSTAKDILFFWVARMNFAGLFFDGRLPYRDVYLHSTVADEQGQTMSKSKGNGIDPISVIDGATMEDLKKPVLEARPPDLKQRLTRIEKQYPNGFEAVGADGMRWTLAYSITEGERVRLSHERFTEGRNFVTKLWNGAGRVIQSLEAEVEREGRPDRAAVASSFARNLEGSGEKDEDRWLLARLDSTIREVRRGFDELDFGTAAQALYRFVWDDFCSWALELSKSRLDHEDAAVRRSALRVMGSVLGDLLKLLHPVIPFVTEELWSRLRPAMDALGLWIDQTPRNELLVLESFPKARSAPQPELESRFSTLQRFVVAVRQLRASSNIKDNLKIAVEVKPLAAHTKAMLEQAAGPVAFLARLDSVTFVEARTKGMAAQYDKDFELYVDLSKYVDLGDEITRLEKAADKADKEAKSARAMLGNEAFTSKAPPEAVEQKREGARHAEERRDKLRETIAELKSLQPSSQSTR
ncbi:MAG: valine--tRNA ligase [Deltaproteobacteria bacterium]|nr:valine--tRNA ligase [Deltaproteobacteria bacterium]